MMASNTIPEGVLRFSVDLRIEAAELATWDPDHIAMLFEGIAKAQRAVCAARHRRDLLVRPAPNATARPTATPEAGG